MGRISVKTDRNALSAVLPDFAETGRVNIPGHEPYLSIILDFYYSTDIIYTHSNGLLTIRVVTITHFYRAKRATAPL